MSKIQNIERVRQLLQNGPAKAAALLEALNISQPTFSRLWSGVPDGVVLGASKARQYALRRQVAGVDAPIPVFRVATNGLIMPIGHLDVLQGGFYAMTPLAGTRYELHQGMPFFVSDLRPQGFLGRLEPGKHRDLELRADILTWTDENVLKYIARRSDNAAGDLILGNDSYARYLASLAAQEAAVLTEQERMQRYPQMADDAMQGDAPGSSAGGEQPKFTAAVRRAHDPCRVEPVIVKFSPRTGTASGRRWGDLLVCEHLALQTLLRNGIAAATSSILEYEGRVFLEVVRVDRVGLTGRRPMATFSALDGDLGIASTGRQIDQIFDVEYEPAEMPKGSKRVLFRIEIKMVKLPTQPTSQTISQIIDCIESFLSPGQENDSWQPTIQGRLANMRWDQKAKPTPRLVLEQSQEGSNVTFRTSRMTKASE